VAIMQETNGFLCFGVRVITIAVIRWIFLRTIVALSGWGRVA